MGIWHTYKRSSMRYGWKRKPEEDALYGRHIRRWKGNTEMEYKGIGWEVVDCVHQARSTERWRAFAKNVMKFLVFINIREFYIHVTVHRNRFLFK
jgi:hypothetical protein